MTSPLTRGAGRSARVSACGWTSCLYRLAPGRRRAARAPARPRRRCDVEDGEDWHRGHAADPAGARGDVARRALRRSRFHRRLARPADGEEVLQQRLHRVPCRAAGVSGSAHGVRKIAATRAANAGATVAQLQAIFGWSGGAMAALYTRAADRRRLATEAMHTLANDKRTSIVAPSALTVAPGKLRNKNNAKFSEGI